MHLPFFITLVITLPFDQVLQVVVPHSAIKYCLYLILLLAVDKSCRWAWHRSSVYRDICPFSYFLYPLPLSTCSYVFPLLTSVLSSRIILKANDF
jgi:hypothetical protein